MRRSSCQGRDSPGFAEHGEIDVAEPIDLAVRAVRGEEQVVHLAEFHLAGVLVQPRENLRQEGGDRLRSSRHRAATRRDLQTFLQRDDRAGDAGQLDGARDDLRGRPILLVRLAEDLADGLGKLVSDVSGSRQDRRARRWRPPRRSDFAARAPVRRSLAAGSSRVQLRDRR